MFRTRGNMTELKQPQAKHSNILLDYANRIISHMQDFIFDKIQEHKLHFDEKFEDWDEVKMSGSSKGLQVSAFFMFKMVYDKDVKFAYEKI